MTATEVQKLFEDRLEKADLMDVVDRETSQFLTDLPEYFVEIVLTDASRQANAEQVVKDVASELGRAGGAKLDAVVRSLWQVDRVWYAGPARTPEGGIRAALDFRAQLKSGRRDKEVRVDVTIAALTILRQKLGRDEFVTGGWSPKRGDVDEESISAAVIAYLEFQLSHGGTSYWDPLLDDHLNLNEAAMSYVLGQSTAFQELHTAITDAFSPPVLKAFIGSLALSQIGMADFERVLPDLSNMLGGAFRRGQRFSISANELFGSLTRGEQELLKRYFLIMARKTKDEQPHLLEEFPSVFAGL